MNWISGLQKAIDYIESHLTEELEAADIAAQANYSPYHFQRVFGILCGYSLGEYIRMRRLTLAGSELASTDIKVIDAALKYGYDSPESFGRAFSWDNASTGEVGQSKVKILFTPFRKTYFGRRQYHEVQN